MLRFNGSKGKMGKTGKWLRSFLTGKKDKEKEKKCPSNTTSPTAAENPTIPTAIRPTTPKEKRRWSFRRSSATAPPPKDTNSTEPVANAAAPAVQPMPAQESKDEQKNDAKAAAVIQPTASANGRASAVEVAAAIKIQCVFRSYLARKALRALKGLVKLQALVRGHLVRRQATATLRCMQALVNAQARVRAQRLRMVGDGKPVHVNRKSTPDYRFRNSYQQEMEKGTEEEVKIVEMDRGEWKGRNQERADKAWRQGWRKQENGQVSPAASALTDMSPRGCSGHFEEYSFTTAQSSPQNSSAVSKPDPSRLPFSFPHPDYAEPLSYDYPLFPNYMANTESSRAKSRSQSAPKSRPDSFERQASRRRPSVEGRNLPRAVRMQRSSSHVGATAQNYHYPWSIKLDRSTVSLVDSECGSTSTVLTNTTYCRSLVGCNLQQGRY